MSNFKNTQLITKLTIAILIFSFFVTLLLLFINTIRITYFDANTGLIKYSYEVVGIEICSYVKNSFASDFYLSHMPEPNEHEWRVITEDAICGGGRRINTAAGNNYGQLRCLEQYAEIYEYETKQPFPLERKIEYYKKILQATLNHDRIQVDYVSNTNDIILKETR